jgi:hypothetical protein
MKYVVEMASGDVIYTKFHDDRFRHSSNIINKLRGCTAGINEGWIYEVRL